jgi:hypothetical protein
LCPASSCPPHQEAVGSPGSVILANPNRQPPTNGPCALLAINRTASACGGFPRNSGG